MSCYIRKHLTSLNASYFEALYLYFYPLKPCGKVSLSIWNLLVIELLKCKMNATHEWNETPSETSAAQGQRAFIIMVIMLEKKLGVWVMPKCYNCYASAFLLFLLLNYLWCLSQVFGVLLFPKYCELTWRRRALWRKPLLMHAVELCQPLEAGKRGTQRAARVRRDCVDLNTRHPQGSLNTPAKWGGLSDRH